MSDKTYSRYVFRDTATGIKFNAYVGREVNEQGEDVVRVEFELLQPFVSITGFAFTLDAAKQLAGFIIEEANR